jgi:hypothetical protein
VNTGSNGHARVTIISDTTDGKAIITASAMGRSASVEVEMYTAMVSVTANPTSIPADGVSTSAIVAVVVDYNNQPISGKAVTLQTTAGTLIAGVAAGPSLVLIADTNGGVSAMLESTEWPGKATVTASIPEGPSGSVDVDFTLGEESSFGDQQDTPYTSDPVNPATGNYIYSKELITSSSPNPVRM